MRGKQYLSCVFQIVGSDLHTGSNFIILTSKRLASTSRNTYEQTCNKQHTYNKRAMTSHTSTVWQCVSSLKKKNTIQYIPYDEQNCALRVLNMEGRTERVSFSPFKIKVCQNPQYCIPGLIQARTHLCQCLNPSCTFILPPYPHLIQQGKVKSIKHVPHPQRWHIDITNRIDI